MKNIAVILAGGTGSRMGSETPKQFLPLGGHCVLFHSVKPFEDSPSIDEVAIVTHRDHRGRVEALVAEAGWKKVSHVIDGGDERYLSSLNAIMAFIDYPDSTNLLFHDAARPCVSARIVEDVCRMLQHYPAVAVGIPATDTLWEIAFNQEALTATPENPYAVLRVPERQRFWQAQTPQAFRLPLIRDAYQRALNDPSFHATDDASVVARYIPEQKVHILQGSPSNIKITHPADLLAAEEFLTNNNK